MLHAWLVGGFVLTAATQNESPTLLLSPFCVCVQVTDCDCEPPPHETVQPLKPPVTHASGHASVLHARVDVGATCPLQKEAAMPTPGWGAEADCTHASAAVCTPPPQSLLHWPHAPSDHV